MIKNISLLGILSIALLTSCTKEKTTVIESNGDSTTITKVGFDDQRIDSTKTKLNSGLEKTGNDIKQGAKELKEDVKDVTADAAAAVEKGARDVKEDAKK